MEPELLELLAELVGEMNNEAYEMNYVEGTTNRSLEEFSPFELMTNNMEAKIQFAGITIWSTTENNTFTDDDQLDSNTIEEDIRFAATKMCELFAKCDFERNDTNDVTDEVAEMSNLPEEPHGCIQAEVDLE